MKSSIAFPTRQIKIINADIELEVLISDEEYARMLTVFQENEMAPLIKLALISPSGDKFEFSNLIFDRVATKEWT